MRIQSQGPSLRELTEKQRSIATIDCTWFSPETLRMMRMEVGQKLTAARRDGFQDVDRLSAAKAAVIAATVEAAMTGRMGR